MYVFIFLADPFPSNSPSPGGRVALLCWMYGHFKLISSNGHDLLYISTYTNTRTSTTHTPYNLTFDQDTSRCQTSDNGCTTTWTVCWYRFWSWNKQSSSNSYFTTANHEHKYKYQNPPNRLQSVVASQSWTYCRPMQLPHPRQRQDLQMNIGESSA